MPNIKNLKESHIVNFLLDLIKNHEDNRYLYSLQLRYA